METTRYQEMEFWKLLTEIHFYLHQNLLEKVIQVIRKMPNPPDTVIFRPPSLTSNSSLSFVAKDLNVWIQTASSLAKKYNIWIFHILSAGAEK